MHLREQPHGRERCGTRCDAAHNVRGHSRGGGGAEPPGYVQRGGRPPADRVPLPSQLPSRPLPLAGPPSAGPVPARDALDLYRRVYGAPALREGGDEHIRGILDGAAGPETTGLGCTAARRAAGERGAGFTADGRGRAPTRPPPAVRRPLASPPRRALVPGARRRRDSQRRQRLCVAGPGSVDHGDYERRAARDGERGGTGARGPLVLSCGQASFPPRGGR